MALNAAEQAELAQLEQLELTANQGAAPSIEPAPQAQGILSNAEFTELQQLEALEQPERTLGESITGVGEAALTAATGLGSTIVGGLTGLIAEPFTDEGVGARASQKIQEFGTVLPKTEAGKESLESLSGAVEFVVDKFRVPVSGIAGVIQLIEGQGLDKAVETIEAVQREGLGETRAQQILAEGGSPEVATLARILPEAGVEIAGALTGAGAFRRGAAAAEKLPAIVEPVKELVRTGKEAAKRAETAITETVPPLVDKLVNFQTKRKQRIAQQLEAQTGDVETAGFRLKNGKAIRDPKQIEAVKQGLPEDFVADINAATPLDKRGMFEMTQIMEKAQTNRGFRRRNRPSDVIGKAVKKRYQAAININKTAGQQLNNLVKTFKGTVDFDPAVAKFVNEGLDEGLGIRLNSVNEPIFKGSAIEGLAGPEGLVRSIVKRMREMDTTRPQALHALKRFIDNQVSYGKTQGLTAATELPFKRFRADIDGLLDTKFPEYDRLNRAYAGTIGPIGELQRLGPKSVDLTGRNADKALGTLTRRLSSNAQSRTALLNTIEDLEGVIKEFTPQPTGKSIVPLGEFAIDLSDDVLRLADYGNTLDKIFGPLQDTAFESGISKGITQAATAGTSKQGLASVALDKAAEAASKLQGINAENAFKSFKELLKE